MQYYQEFIGHIWSGNCLGWDVTRCSCIRDLVTDLELQLAADQYLTAHGGRSNDVQREFFSEWERGAANQVHQYDRKKRVVKSGRQFKGLQKRLRPYQLSGVLSSGSRPYYIVATFIWSFLELGQTRWEPSRNELSKAVLFLPLMVYVLDREIPLFPMKWKIPSWILWASRQRSWTARI